MVLRGGRHRGPAGQWPVKTFLWLSLILAALSALWLTAIQYRSLDAIVRSEAEHRRSALGSALSRASNGVSFELSRANLTFHMGSIGAEQAAIVLDTWDKLAPYPAIVRGAYWFDAAIRHQPSLTPVRKSPLPDGDKAGRLQGLVQALSRRNSGSVTPASPELAELVEEPFGIVISAPPDMPGAFPGGLPGINFERPPTALRGLFVLLDQDYALHKLLPSLLTLESGYREADYDLAVFRASDGKRLSGGGPVAGPEAVTSAVVLRILPGCPGPFGTGAIADRMGLMKRPTPSGLAVVLKPLLTAKAADCPAPGIASGRGVLWNLSAWPRSAFALSKFENRSLLVTAAAAVCLVGSLGMLVLLLVRTHHLARLQVDFVASVSHELRTPIGTIGVAGDNLSSGLVQNREDAVQYGKVIQTETKRLSGLVEQVLSYARALSTRWGPPATSLAVDQIIELALCNCGPSLEATGMAVQKLMGPNLPYVRGDLHALARCLQNLLDNCAKYASGGGVVILRAESSRGMYGLEIQVCVEDRGPGIPAAERKRIFDPFIRGSQCGRNGVSGFGLGLNIAKRIVEAHHGTIEAFQPETGTGAGFRIKLPGYDPVQREAE
jgi:signal transduction histidine kinase